MHWDDIYILYGTIFKCARPLIHVILAYYLKLNQMFICPFVIYTNMKNIILIIRKDFSFFVLLCYKLIKVNHKFFDLFRVSLKKTYFGKIQFTLKHVTQVSYIAHGNYVVNDQKSPTDIMLYMIRNSRQSLMPCLLIGLIQHV